MKSRTCELDDREFPAMAGQRSMADLSEAELDRLIFLGAKAGLAGLSDAEHLEFRRLSLAVTPLPLTGLDAEDFRPSRDEELEILKNVLAEGGLEVPDEALRTFAAAADAALVPPCQNS
jgi:hypothetical protein